MTKMAVTVAGIEFANPVITASGTFGFGREYAEFFPLSELGGICVKSLTAAKRAGNPPPRVAETPMGMLNSVGLQNPGVKHFIKRELPLLKESGTRILANISGATAEEYALVAAELGDLVDMLEVNISCPNVKEGGIAFGTSPSAAAKVTSAVKRAAKVPVIVKLSPNVTDVCEIARAAEESGADAVSLINTLLGMRIDVKTRRPVLFNNVGGLSGPAVKPVALRMVWQVSNAVKIPVIGMGGIASGEDAVEFMLAGASLVAVGTAGFVDPLAWLCVRDGIREYLENNRISDVNDIIGRVELNR